MVLHWALELSMVGKLDHLLVYAQNVEKQALQHEQNARKRACYRKHEYADLASYKELTTSGKANFDRFERALDMYFDLTGFKLGYMQVWPSPRPMHSPP
jgi:hypothetical protein